MQKDKNVHYSTFTEEDIKKDKQKNFRKSLLFVILGTIIYSVAVVWILRLGGFISGGATGLSQLTVGLVEKYCTNPKVINFFSNNLGSFITIINIPLLAIAWKGLSKKFVILTILSIAIQTIVMNVLATFTVSPFVYLIKSSTEVLEVIRNGGAGNIVGEGLLDLNQSNFHFFKTAVSSADYASFQATMLPSVRLLLALLGGFFCGYGASLCLRGGGSTGGVDIIANYFHVRKHTPFTLYQATIDVSIIGLSSLISVESVLYTLIRLYVYTITIRTFYTIYRTCRIEIVTTKHDEIKDVLFKRLSHGITSYTCVGEYTNEVKTAFVIYASRYEVSLYTRIVQDIDPHAFITVTRTEIAGGNFIQKTIV